MFVWPRETYDRALGLLADGLSINSVARLVGVPRATVGYWSRRPARRQRGLVVPANWRPPEASAYAYLLGAYLGDGHVTRNGNSVTLHVSLDAGHPSIVEEIACAIGAIVPARPIHRFESDRRGRVVVLRATAPVWIAAFPQHGPGKKHLRRIELEPWQREITHAYPRELIRGLIHSDGCRSVNRFKTKLPSGRVREYAYVRYFFSNLSEDIKEIFCEHCDLLGIRCSRANPRYVSVHDRRSVAVLDEFVGPKC